LLPYIPGGSCKHLEGERHSKVGFSSGHQLREFLIVFKPDVDGMPTLFTEVAASKKVVFGFKMSLVAVAAYAIIVKRKSFP